MRTVTLVNQLTEKDEEISSLKKKVAEMELRLLLEKKGNSDVLESMSDAFVSIDRDWNILAVNHHMERITKIKRETHVGRNFLDVFFPDSSGDETIYIKSYKKAMKESIHIYFEDYYPPLDLWTACNVFPIADGGIAIFFRDISEEKRSRHLVESDKQKLETIFMNSSHAMALLKGPDFIYEKVNPQYQELTAYRELIGKKRRDVFPDLEGQVMFNLLTKVYESGETFKTHEMKVSLIRRKDHGPEECYFDFSYSRVEDGDGNPYGVYISAIDITETVISRKNLEDSLKYKEDFISIASHELRTPLTSLKLQSQMNKRIYDKDGIEGFTAAQINKLIMTPLLQAERLTHLVDDMLDISRISTGKMQMSYESVNLATLIEVTVENFLTQLSAAGCDVEFTLDKDITGNWDGFRLEQVITNLITNAMKYAPGKPIKIRLINNGSHAVFNVQDHGKGIAADKLDRVFERFERIDVSKNISGLGLGLYISKQIVEIHGGTITVESKPGLGANFIVSLPLG